jgi:hypothetical protein
MGEDDAVPNGFVVVPASYVALLRPGAAGLEVLLMLREGTGYMDGHWALVAAMWSRRDLRAGGRA